MPQKKEPCRHFLRGSCQFGDRCKYLHVAPHQSKPNTFGFGLQNQQQKPNPFGFGVQSTANDFGSKQNQFKPFENKWTRFSPINNNNSSTTSRRPDNQPPQPAHKCTDAESCKREIVEDFQNERPMWKLTCYGHCKNGPCDIVGDISYEELRAAAYDDAKRGLNMQSIVERERNLLQAKLGEFESLIRNPYAVRSNPTPSSQNPFSGGKPNATVTAQSSGPPLVSSFSQLGASVNTGAGISSVAPSSNLFGQPNPFQNLTQGPPSNNAFGQPNSFENLREKSGFGMDNKTFGNAGALASQVTPVTPQSPFTSILASVSNGASAGHNTFFNSAASSQISDSADNRSQSFSGGPIVSLHAIGESTINTELMNGTQREKDVGDGSIWMKVAWSRGEIPEEAPPDKYIF